MNTSRRTLLAGNALWFSIGTDMPEIDVFTCEFIGFTRKPGFKDEDPDVVLGPRWRRAVLIDRPQKDSSARGQQATPP